MSTFFGSADSDGPAAGFAAAAGCAPASVAGWPAVEVASSAFFEQPATRRRQAAAISKRFMWVSENWRVFRFASGSAD